LQSCKNAHRSYVRDMIWQFFRFPKSSWIAPLGNELRNGLPESAQGFLIFGSAKYYDGVSFNGRDLRILAGNTLKTSGLNARCRAFALSLKIPRLSMFGVSCAK
jgi:hypothetical protein